MSDERDISEETYSRRTTLKLAGMTAGVALVGSTAAAAKGKPSAFDPSLVNVVNVLDADSPTLRIDNENGTAAKVLIHSTGASDGMVYTVGANQAGYKGKQDDKPNVDGKFVDAECGETITDVETKRPQDKTWMPSGFTGTATVGGPNTGCP